MAFMGVFDCGRAFLCGVFDLAGGFGSWGLFCWFWGFCLRCFMGGIRGGWGLREVGKKKWQKVAGIVCLVISVINLGLAGKLLFYYAYGTGNEDS